MKKTILVLLACVSTIIKVSAQNAKKEVDPLEGKSFVVSLMDQGKESKDTLIFKNMMFESTGCRKLGFGKSKYHSSKSNSDIKFTSKSESEKEGINNWSGTLSGDNISGKLIWAKPGQKEIIYDFKGSIIK